MIPLWQQALMARAGDKQPRLGATNGYMRDERRVLAIIASVLPEWGIERWEVNGLGGPGKKIDLFPFAARAQILRECWRANIAPCCVVKILGLSRRTVTKWYREANMRLKRAEVPKEPASGVRVA